MTQEALAVIKDVMKKHGCRHISILAPDSCISIYFRGGHVAIWHSREKERPYRTSATAALTMAQEFIDALQAAIKAHSINIDDIMQVSCMVDAPLAASDSAPNIHRKKGGK